MHQHFFWADLHKVVLFLIPMLQNIRAFDRIGLRDMAGDQHLQLLLPMGNRDRASHQSFHIHHGSRCSGRIIKIGHATRHPRAEVGTNGS